MKHDDIRKVLGGYATGTLTDQEREQLFTAALEDQILFDALADEEALRELLAEPQIRLDLLRELRRHPASLWSRLWDQLTPGRLAVAGGLAMALLVFSGVQYVRQHPSASQEVAMSRSAQIARPADVPSPSSRPAEAESGLRQPAPRETPKRSASLPKSPSASQPARSSDVPANPPAADERRDQAPAPVVVENSPEKKAEQQAETIREKQSLPQPRREADSASKELVERATKSAPAGIAAPPPPVSAPAPQAVAGLVTRANSKEETERKRLAAVARAQGMVAGFRQMARPVPPGAASAVAGGREALSVIDLTVTDLNGTIVSLSAGNETGLKAGEALEIVHDRRVIGTVTLTEAGEGFAVGPFHPLPGTKETPRPGDRVRRPQARQQ